MKEITCEVAKAENLEYMSTLPSESIHMIYIDPPFNTSKIQKKRNFKPNQWPEKVIDLEYYDSFGSGIQGYLEFMRPRLQHCHRLLNEEGVLCVHLDYKSVHYIKCLLDEIFGEKDIDRGSRHLINEVVWSYNQGIKASTRKFLSNHDIILIYSKNNNHQFNPQVIQYTKEQLKRFKEDDNDGKGNYYLDTRRDKDNKKKRVKVYLTKEGTPIGSVWSIKKVQGHEYLYPTQKPVDLLERLIKTFTNKNNKVADFFCGCGTTLEAAFNLKRNFIGCDAQEDAIKAIKKRISMKSLNKDLIKISYPFDEIPQDLTKMTPKDFQRKCVLFVEGVPNAKMSNDSGIDGIRIKDGAIIQVKKSPKIAAHHIRELLGAMTANRTKKGIFVAYSFINSARNLVNQIKKNGYDVELKTVAQLQKEAKARKNEVSIKEEKIQKERIQKAREIAPENSKKKSLKLK